MEVGRSSYFSNPPSNPFNVPVTIGNFTSIGSDLKLVGGQHASVVNKNVVSNYPFNELWGVQYQKGKHNGIGPIAIGNDVWIGMQVTILDNVNIGDGAILGAKTVVAKDIPPYAVVVGNPCKIIRYRFSQDIIDKLLKIKWWNFTDEEIKTNISLFNNIDEFIKKYEK